MYYLNVKSGIFILLKEKISKLFYVIPVLSPIFLPHFSKEMF